MKKKKKKWKNLGESCEGTRNIKWGQNIETRGWKKRKVMKLEEKGNVRKKQSKVEGVSEVEKTLKGQTKRKRLRWCWAEKKRKEEKENISENGKKRKKNQEIIRYG